MVIWRQRLVFGAAVSLCLLFPVTRAQPGTDAASTWAPSPAAAESVITCLTGDALLDTPIMRDLLGVLWAHSHANDRAARRRERGAILFDSAGVLFYRADLDDPSDTPCRSTLTVPLGPTPVAAVFTHPFQPGDLLPRNCNFRDARDRRYSVDDLGGPSEFDLIALADWDLPGYIMDQQYIYAIPLGTTKETAKLVIRRYPRFDAVARCSII